MPWILLHCHKGTLQEVVPYTQPQPLVAREVVRLVSVLVIDLHHLKVPVRTWASVVVAYSESPDLAHREELELELIGLHAFKVLRAGGEEGRRGVAEVTMQGNMNIRILESEGAVRFIALIRSD